jgi:hypothetical protein
MSNLYIRGIYKRKNGRHFNNAEMLNSTDIKVTAGFTRRKLFFRHSGTNTQCDSYCVKSNVYLGTIPEE